MNTLANTKEDSKLDCTDARAIPQDDRILVYLVIGVMPFLYGTATRLPFIYFVIHLAVHFELSWWIIGLCVGAYQSGRVIINVTTIFAPKISHFFGTAIGFAGYCTVFLCDKDLVAPFVIGTAVIGFSETVASMQNYAKELFQLDPDRKRAQRMLKYQYASVMCGVMFAFSVGGVLYQYFSINGVALFGMLVEGFGLMALIWYMTIKMKRGESVNTTNKKPMEPGRMEGETERTQRQDFRSRQTTDTKDQVSSIEDGISDCSDDFDVEIREEGQDNTIEFYPIDDEVQVSKEQVDTHSDKDEDDIEMGVVSFCDSTTKDKVQMDSPRRSLFDENVLDALEDMQAVSDAQTESMSGQGEDEVGGEAVSTESSCDESPTCSPFEEGAQGEGHKNGQRIGAKSELTTSTGSSEHKDEDELYDSSIEEGSLSNSANHPTDCRSRVLSMIGVANAHYPTADGIPATWVNYLVCLSFGIEALTIGYNLSIGPILILNQFDTGTGITGFLFAIGAGFGSIITMAVTCTEWGNKTFRKLITSPFDVCIAMVGIAVGVFIASVPSFPIHVVGLLLLMAFNDLGATLLTEFQGSITTVSTYSVLGPLGQVVRRSLNVVTAVTGPILFGIYPSLPYIVAGTITLLWAVMLAIVFRVRIAGTMERLVDTTGRSDQSLCSLMSFQTREVVRSVSKKFANDFYVPGDFAVSR